MSKRNYFNLKKGSTGGHVVFHSRNKKHYRPPENKQKQLAKARTYDLILNATEAELALKRTLEQSGINFYFQYAIIRKTNFNIVDFCFPRGLKTYLIVEVDGGYHLTDKQKEKDSRRTKWLIEHTGCELIRFTNEQILGNLQGCLERIISKDILYNTVKPLKMTG